MDAENIAPQPPAEAQAQGGGEAGLRRMVAKLAAHVRPTCGELWAEAERLLNSTAPPSAPVGVEGLPAKWRAEADEIASNNWTCNSNSIRARADELESALAQQPAAIPRLANCGRYTATDNTGQHYYLNHANTWQAFQGQQPAAVNGEMVERVAISIYAAARGFSAEVAREKWPSVEQKSRFTGPARAALATQPGGSDNDQ